MECSITYLQLYLVYWHIKMNVLIELIFCKIFFLSVYQNVLNTQSVNICWKCNKFFSSSFFEFLLNVGHTYVNTPDWPNDIPSPSQFVCLISIFIHLYKNIFLLLIIHFDSQIFYSTGFLWAKNRLISKLEE